MANISLAGSIKTCKIDSAYAAKIQSDRFLNPGNMLCPVWQGVDTTGRSACAYSYNNKTAGCNSAADRVNVENALRPNYIEYVTLDARGIQGSECQAQPRNPDTQCHEAFLDNTHKYTGQFGLVSGFSSVNANCVSCSNRVTPQNFPGNVDGTVAKNGEDIVLNKQSSGQQQTQSRQVQLQSQSNMAAISRFLSGMGL